MSSKKTRAGALLMIMLIVMLLFVPAQQAHAISDVVVAPESDVFLAGILAAIGIVESAEASLVAKEFVLDPIAWAIAKLVIQALTSSIVDWINSGFDGNPLYVTDLRRHLADITEQVVGFYIEDQGLGALCDPFGLPIRQALARHYGTPFELKTSCRLSDVVDNIDAFLAGDFSRGGWEGWYELVTGDNPYNRYLEARGQIDKEIAEAVELEKTELGFSNGFISWRECRERETGAPAGSFRASQDMGVVDCEVVTPGIVIERQLSNALGVGLDELKLADEFNEIVSALLVQLTNQIFSGTGGLRGLSRSSSSGSSFTDRLRSDRSASGAILGNSQSITVNEIDAALSTERSFRSNTQTGLTAVLSAESLNGELRECRPDKAATFEGVIASRKAEFSAEVVGVDRLIFQLTALRDELVSASSVSAADRAAREYIELRTRGALHNSSDVTQTRIRSDNVEAEMQELENEITQELRTCS